MKRIRLNKSGNVKDMQISINTRLCLKMSPMFTKQNEGLMNENSAR